jgi:hypothetical protein
MFIYNFLGVIFFTFSTAICLSGIGSGDCKFWQAPLNFTDTLKENQTLYNGRLWINTTYKVKGHPYFLTGEYLSGSITFNGKVFPRQRFKYDTYNDEIILWINPQTVIYLNKEMIDSVSLDYQNKSYKIVSFGDDSTSIVKGLVNVYYGGPTSLLVKNKKMIDLLAVERKYDLFYETIRMYVKKDDKIYPVTGKKDLLEILEDKNAEVKNYIKANKLIIMRKDPESFVPVLRYYDSLKE